MLFYCNILHNDYIILYYIIYIYIKSLYTNGVDWICLIPSNGREHLMTEIT